MRCYGNGSDPDSNGFCTRMRSTQSPWGHPFVTLQRLNLKTSVPAPSPFVHPLGTTLVGVRLTLTVRNSIIFLPIHSSWEQGRIEDHARKHKICFVGFVFKSPLAVESVCVLLFLCVVWACLYFLHPYWRFIFGGLPLSHSPHTESQEYLGI